MSHDSLLPVHMIPRCRSSKQKPVTSGLMLIKCCLVAVGVLAVIVVMKAQVMLAPRDVKVCPDSQDVVIITCNESRSRVRWRIKAPLMLVDTEFADDRDPIGIPEPFGGLAGGVNLTVHSASDTSISSSVTVDTSYFNLTTSSEIRVSCGPAADPPFASIRLWGKVTIKGHFAFDDVICFTARFTCNTRPKLCV